MTITGDTEADEAGLIADVALTIGEHEHMELVQIARYTQAVHGCKDGFYFILRDISAAELENLRNSGDIDYIAITIRIEL